MKYNVYTAIFAMALLLSLPVVAYIPSIASVSNALENAMHMNATNSLAGSINANFHINNPSSQNSTFAYFYNYTNISGKPVLTKYTPKEQARSIGYPVAYSSGNPCQVGSSTAGTSIHTLASALETHTTASTRFRVYNCPFMSASKLAGGALKNGNNGYTFSYNWAGYVAQANPDNPQNDITGVNGSWVVQNIAPSQGPTYSAQWIGIGGYSDKTLIQTGTSSEYNTSSIGPTFYAWYELIPSYEVQLNYTVKPGDIMSASIKEVSANMWNITITDMSEGWKYSTVQNYNSSKLSAEFVEERPELCYGFLCFLTYLSNFSVSHYGSYFTNSLADTVTISGNTLPLNSTQYTKIIMLNATLTTGQSYAAPGGVYHNDSFNMIYGPYITPLPTGADSGNKVPIPLTAHVGSIGGSSSTYNYTWYLNGNKFASGNSNKAIFKWNATTNETPDYVYVNVHNATMNVTSLNLYNQISINPALQTPNFTLLYPKIDSASCNFIIYSCAEEIWLTQFDLYVNGGTPPYSTNFTLSHASNHTTSYHWFLPDFLGAYPYNESTLWYGQVFTGNFLANDIITDSAYPSMTKSSPYDLITFAPMLNSTLTSSAGQVIDLGESNHTKFTAKLNGGTGPFSVYMYNISIPQLFLGYLGGNILGSFSGVPVNGIVSSNFTINATGLYIIAAYTIDNGTSYPITNLNANYILVNPRLNYPTFAVDNLSLGTVTADSAQNISVYSSESGGTPPYLFNISIINISSGRPITNTRSNSINSTVAQFNDIPAGGYVADINARDSASTPVSLSNKTYGININPTPHAVIAANVIKLDLGQTVPYNARISGGTGPFNTSLIFDGKARGSSLVGNAISNLSKLYVGGNITSGPFKVVLNGISYPNGTPAGITVYKNGAMENASYIRRGSIAAFNINGTALYVAMPDAFAGSNTTDRWADIQLFGVISQSASYNATFLYKPNSTGKHVFNVSATDLGTTLPYTFNSQSGEAVVGEPLGRPMIEEQSQIKADLGQTLPLKISLPQNERGTSPYSYYAYYLNSSGVIVHSASEIGINSSNATFSFSPNSPGEYGVIANVVDNSYIPENASNNMSAVYSVAENPRISLSPITNGTIYMNQPIEYNLTLSGGGFGPYAMNISGGGNVSSTIVVSNAGSSETLFVYPENAHGDVAFNASAVDKGTTIPYLFHSSNAVYITPAIKEALRIPANSASNVSFSDANAIIRISSANTITANVFIENVTGNYSSLPSAPQKKFTKVVLLNISINSTDTGINASIELSGCSNNIAPYILRNGTWGAIPFTINSVTCEITAEMPLDPIVGLFSSQTIQPPPGGSGSGGGSGGSSGGYSGGSGGSSGGAVSGGAPAGPTVLPAKSLNGTCYAIYNFAQDDHASVNLPGMNFTAIENYIQTSGAGVTINGTSYSLAVNSPELISKSAINSYYANILNVSWIPVEHAITLEICAEPSIGYMPSTLNSANGSGIVNLSASSPFTVDFSGANTSIKIISNLTKANAGILYLKNETAAELPVPSGGLERYEVISLGYKELYPNEGVKFDISMGYQCGEISNPAPYALVSGAWVPISNFTSDKASCTISFSRSGNQTIGLLAEIPAHGSAASASSKAQQNNESANSISESPAVNTSTGKNTGKKNVAYIALIPAAIALAAAVVFVDRRRRKKPENEGPASGAGGPPVQPDTGNAEGYTGGQAHSNQSESHKEENTTLQPASTSEGAAQQNA